MNGFWQRRKWDIIGVTLAVLCGGGMIASYRMVIQPQNYQRTCQSNLKQIGMALLQYSRDYDERLPLTEDWVNGLWPYSRSKVILRCPSRPDLPVGYAIHSGVSRLYGYPMISSPARTIFVFDSDVGGANPVDDGKLLPRPARHPKGHGVAFLDGHVKHLQNPNFAFGYDERVLKPLREAEIQRTAEFWRGIEARDKAAARQNAAKRKASKRKAANKKAQTR